MNHSPKSAPEVIVAWNESSSAFDSFAFGAYIAPDGGSILGLRLLS